MSSITAHHDLIAYELIEEEHHPEVTVIEFSCGDILGPNQARELRDELDLLIATGLPRNVVIDFRHARMLGSSAFGVIVRFVRQLASVRVCNISHSLRLGAALIGLDDWVDVSESRESAIRDAMGDARRGREETADYPVLTG
jgi:anti-anti-sigma regulatory factor